MHDRLELPVPVTLVGLRPQDVLFVERLTTATNPFCPVIVILDVAVAPALAVTVGGLAAIA